MIFGEQAQGILRPFIEITSGMGRIYLAKYFCRQATRTRSFFNDPFFFVSWCLAGQ
jgi:hypothetical protein